MGDLTGSVAEGKKKAKLTLSMEKISCGRATGGGSRPWEETQERGAHRMLAPGVAES